jgi:hypothetical protein
MLVLSFTGFDPNRSCIARLFDHLVGAHTSTVGGIWMPSAAGDWVAQGAAVASSPPGRAI